MTGKKNGNTSVLIIQNDNLEWYKRNSDRLFSALFSRIAGGETDRYPGYARWDGDGIPGMQIVWNADSSTIGLLAVGRGSGQRLASVHGLGNPNTEDNKVSLLKALANQLGYTVTKKRKNTISK
jgi:hypothetical protein